MERQIFQMHRALSFDIAGWAPPRDKSVELFSRVSIPPAIVSKDDREWNLVLANIVQGEHIDGGALLGRRCAVPFRFRHSPPLPGGSKRLDWSHWPYVGGDQFILHDTGGNGSPAESIGLNKLRGFSAVKSYGLRLGYA